MFEVGMSELTQVNALFLISDLGPKDLLDDEVYRQKYSKINLKKVILILEKYRNDKLTPKDIAGNTELEKLKVKEVHKSDAQAVAKKMREKINFK